MKYLVCLGLLVVGSCASGPPKGFPLPDGRTGYNAYCDGRWNTMADCYREAAKFCGGKYEIVDQDQTSSVVGVNGIVAPVTRRNLYFTCETKPLS